MVCAPFNEEPRRGRQSPVDRWRGPARRRDAKSVPESGPIPVQIATSAAHQRNPGTDVRTVPERPEQGDGDECAGDPGRAYRQRER